MKRFTFTVLAASMCFAPHFAGAEPSLNRWGSFSIGAYAAAGFDFEVEILSDHERAASKDAYFKLVRTQHQLIQPGRRLGTHAVKTWTDSRQCPAVLERLSALKTLKMPHFDAFGWSDVAATTVDGDDETIDAPGLFGPDGAEATIRISATNSPELGGWIKDTMAALKPCWRPLP